MPASTTKAAPAPANKPKRPCEAAARAVQASQQRIGRPVKPRASPWAKFCLKLRKKAAGSAPPCPRRARQHTRCSATQAGPRVRRGAQQSRKSRLHNSSPARFENRASIKRAGPMGRRLAVQGWCGSKFQKPISAPPFSFQYSTRRQPPKYRYLLKNTDILREAFLCFVFFVLFKGAPRGSGKAASPWRHRKKYSKRGKESDG